jgi:hypothetical protein
MHGIVKERDVTVGVTQTKLVRRQFGRVTAMQPFTPSASRDPVREECPQVTNLPTLSISYVEGKPYCPPHLNHF